MSKIDKPGNHHTYFPFQLDWRSDKFMTQFLRASYTVQLQMGIYLQVKAWYNQRWFQNIFYCLFSIFVSYRTRSGVQSVDYSRTFFLYVRFWFFLLCTSHLCVVVLWRRNQNPHQRRHLFAKLWRRRCRGGITISIWQKVMQ